MPNKTKINDQALLRAIEKLREQGHSAVSSSQLVEFTGASLATIKRMLERLCQTTSCSERGWHVRHATG